MWKLIALVLAKMMRVRYVGGVILKNSLVLLLHIHTILMGILGVVVVLDEVELDVDMGIPLSKALGASSNASIST